MIRIRYEKFVALTQPQELGESMPLIRVGNQLVEMADQFERICVETDGLILLLESQDH